MKTKTTRSLLWIWFPLFGDNDGSDKLRKWEAVVGMAGVLSTYRDLKKGRVAESKAHLRFL